MLGNVQLYLTLTGFKGVKGSQKKFKTSDSIMIHTYLGTYLECKMNGQVSNFC